MYGPSIKNSRSESPVGLNLLKNNFKIRQKVAGDETDLRRR